MSDLRLPDETASHIRKEIERAGGREVCFLARVDEERNVLEPRAVARGNHDAVLVAARDAEQGGVVIHNHPSGILDPSPSDLAVAHRLYGMGLGTAIVDNQAGSLYVVVEPPEPRVLVPIDPGSLDGILAPGGTLSRAHPGYEDRAGQRQMLRHVVEAYNGEGILVVEAGTGTGKTLAYLLPVARWALENGERTVISTNTINLQEQLVRHDLPLAARILEDAEEGAPARGNGDDSGADGAATLSWALVKGRGNYISIRRARLAVEEAGSLFESDRDDELSAIVEWLDSTDDGSLSDLGFVPSPDVWDEVRSDSDICLRARCPHFQACFYQRSRRRASASDVLVVNHHLLFTDLAVRGTTGNYTDAAVLPPYRRLVLDEAHNLEDAATSHLGVDVTRVGIYRTLSRLERDGRGVLAAVAEALRARPELGWAGEHLKRIEEKVRPALKRSRSRADRFFRALEPYLPEREGEAVRLGEGESDPASDDAFRERLEAFVSTLGELEAAISALRRRIEMDEPWEAELEGRLLDLGSVERRVASASSALRLVLVPDRKDGTEHVRWVEQRGSGRRGKGNPRLAAAPIELGPLLREALFDPMESTVLSSATLTTGGGFDFFRERIGLPAPEDHDPLAERVDEVVVPSPFDFAHQTVLAVPTDLPDPTGAGEGFQQATAGVVSDLAGRTGGGVFVLFTSHRAIAAVAEELRSAGVAGRFPLFVHGEESRARLLEGFVESGRGILLGTSSFWEGVDVPGDPLRALIIQKLPFRVPTEPVTAARIEALEARGRDAFWQYMLPHAALRLKQGFGRLVRSRTDRGAVVLLDDRILRRRYGRYLRRSLPDSPLVKGPWVEVLHRLDRFYEEGRAP